MTINTAPRVLVVSAADADGAARVPKLLTDAGAQVTLMCSPLYRMAKTKHKAAFIPTDPDSRAIIDLLQHVLERDSYDMVVFTTDPLLYEVYSRADNGWIAKHMTVDPTGPVGDIVGSKNAFLLACTEAGIPVPAYEICSSQQEALQAAGRIGYPVIVKLDQGYSGLGVRKAENPGDIIAMFDSHFAMGSFAVQKFVAGRVGTTSIIYRRGKPLYHCAAYYHKCWPTPYHPPSQRKITHRPVFLEHANMMGALTNYQGFGGIDWIEDAQTGEVYVLELNARPMPMHTIAPSFKGVAKALRALLADRDIEPVAPGGKDGQVYCMWPKDAMRALDEKDYAGVLRWLTILPFTRAMPWDDPALLADQAGLVFRYYAKVAGWYRNGIAKRLQRLTGVTQRA